MHEVVLKKEGRYTLVKRESRLHASQMRYAIIKQDVFCWREVEQFRNLRKAARAWKKFIAELMLLAVLLVRPGIAAEAPPDFNAIVDRIYVIEGAERAKVPYGILSVKCSSREECRRVCMNTVRNNWRRWDKAGRPGEYLDFLADRYCPIKSDPIGNRNWKANMRRMVKS